MHPTDWYFRIWLTNKDKRKEKGIGRRMRGAEPTHEAESLPSDKPGVLLDGRLEVPESFEDRRVQVVGRDVPHQIHQVPVARGAEDLVEEEDRVQGHRLRIRLQSLLFLLSFLAQIRLGGGFSVAPTGEGREGSVQGVEGQVEVAARLPEASQAREARRG